MSILGRQTLYSIFVNGAIPTAGDFQNLIDSTLNRKDDCFFGKWQPGVTYCEGDVVLYKKSLYMLALPEEEECEPVEDENSEEVPKGCICSDIPPEEDTERWCLLELKIQDDDWELIKDPDSGNVIGVARVAGRVAIGTMQPKAKLDITDEVSGQILAEPDQKGHPAITLLRLSESDDEFEPPEEIARVDYRLEEERVCWDTDTLGYVFKVMGEEVSEISTSSVQQEGEKGQSAKATTPPAELPVLLLITHTSEGRPSIGIGVDPPAATLDIKADDKGRLLVNPHVHSEAEIILTNLKPAGSNSYFLTEVGDNQTLISTNADKGFLFTQAQDDYFDLINDPKGASGKPLLSMTETDDEEVRVGVGTAEPAAILDVIRKNSGQFKMVVEKPNPAFAIVNLRPQQQGNYLTLGADNDQSVFLTDGDDGFVFCKGERYDPETPHEDNIGQQNSEELVRIQTQCKSGDPDQVDKLKLIPTLDVNGIERVYASYLRAGKNEYSSTGELEGVLSKVCNLQAIKFRWKENKTRCGDIGEQIGLRTDLLEENFPQVIMKAMNGDKAIAYQNLVPVLVEAVKELAEEVGTLKDRLAALEGKGGS